MTIRRVLPILAAFWLLSCSPAGEPARDEGQPPATPPDTSGAFQGRIYERTVVFMSPGSELDLILPWSFQARTRPGGVERRSRGWLARDGSWDFFHSREWQTPPSRAPWRVLPRGPLRILVGEGDALERFVYEEGPRSVELGFGSTLVDWSGQRGETFRIQDGELLFSGTRVQSVLLDLVRARAAQDPTPGDWAFLVAGDSVQVVVEDPGGGPEARDSMPRPDAPGAYRAWARVDFRDTQWTGVSVLWEETRAFEEARRDVPVAWSISSGDGELEGRIQVQNAWLSAGEGPGPLLPVEALYQVQGEIRIQGLGYPVRGLFHHVQP